VPKSVIDHFAKSIARPGRLTAALNYYRANLGSGGAAWERLANTGPINAPTTLLWGDQDPALGRRGAESSASYVEADYRFEVLEGAGHWLQFERPAEVSGALTDRATR
jgi:pimeloyl-ACP methyl ester carboxylesterase